MYHYVYLLEFSDGMKYIGARSIHFNPELDTKYLGSGRALPKDRTLHNCTKTILSVFDTRKEAMDFEEDLIVEHDAVNSDAFYNVRRKTFDRHGSSNSPETRENIRKIMLKRVTKKDWCIYRKGDNRTPAQKDGTRRMVEKLTGVKNPAKGHKGIKNQGFIPWYYITPCGEYVEVHDKTKIEMAPILGFTPRQIGHGFHHTNMHLKSKFPPRKGWTFGNLPRPTDLDED